MQQDPEEGVIKFHCEHIAASALPDYILTDLKHFRQLLYMQNLIGKDQYGVGYGNISQRFGEKNKFIITGTQTGHLPELQSEHFTLVEEFDFAKNRLKCIGPVKASSESLTHAALYSVDSHINAVIHIHHAKSWHKHIHKYPTTAGNISYGSPEMAFAIMDLYNTDEMKSGVVIMGGHKDGIIAYGKNLPDAYNNLLNIIE